VPDAEKEIVFWRSSLEDLRAFPRDAKSIIGYQLQRVGQGWAPDHFKPMRLVGPGVMEIIVDTGDAYRVFYVAKFPNAVYVLHAFQKTTRQTAPADIELGRKRYQEVVAVQAAAKRAQNKKKS
jgi:phage-related protein